MLDEVIISEAMVKEIGESISITNLIEFETIEILTFTILLHISGNLDWHHLLLSICQSLTEIETILRHIATPIAEASAIQRHVTLLPLSNSISIVIVVLNPLQCFTVLLFIVFDCHHIE